MPTSGGTAAPHATTADRSMAQALESFVTQTWAVAAAEVQKLRHDPLELFTRAIQPVLWLMLFGEVMARVRGVAPGNIPYLDFRVGIVGWHFVQEGPLCGTPPRLVPWQ